MTPQRFLKFTDVDNNANIYRDTFERSTAPAPERLTIAPASEQIELISKLLELMPGPFGFLYILVIPRGGSENGRYQLKETLTLAGIKSLLADYKDFFEGDGRHSFFVASHLDRALLVYDRHNVVYAYGDLDKYESLLVNSGFREQVVMFPLPHAHHYHDEFDSEEKRLLSSYEWLTFPLEEYDSE